MPGIEHFRASAAGDEEMPGLFVGWQAVRSVLAAGGLPGGDGLVGPEVDGQGAVLVLEIGIEPPTLAGHGEALGVAFEGELDLLRERRRVENAHGLVSWRRHPDFPGRRDVEDAVGHGVERMADAAGEALCVESANAG